MMNTWNQLLPDVVRNDLHHDELESTTLLERYINEIRTTLSDKQELVDNKATGKFTRQLTTHLTLKYRLDVTLVDKALNLLMDMYLSKQLSVPMKVKVLQSMKNLLKAANSKFMGPSADGASDQPTLTFRFSYLPLWQDIMGIVSRDGRGAAICSDHLLSELLTALVALLHGARQYIRTDGPAGAPDSIDTLIGTAMDKLSDLRYPVCVEGVLLLVNCLPTAYAHYDTMVPRWVQCWLGDAAGQGGLDNNAHWDYAWLTLLARARKHYRPAADSGFSWQSLLPVLITKATRLISIPASTGAESSTAVQSANFPHTFPAHFARVLMVQTAEQAGSAEPRDMALRKLAKLLYFITSTVHVDGEGNPILVPALCSTITPPECAAAALAAAQVPAVGDELRVLPGAVDVMQLMLSLRVYFYPSNTGNWTPLLSNFFIMYGVQFCRHVGHALATALQGSDSSRKRHLTHAVHLPTVQYLVTNLLSFCLEGLYSKNHYMSQCCSQCIKNLSTVQPAVCAPIVVPFLLAALDPAAVSQAHQAPVAMQTLANCYKAFMYPQPVLLPYLQEILRLSLPGIEPSDVMKTSITLNMYGNILAWLPTTLRSFDASAADALPRAYMDVLAESPLTYGKVATTPEITVDTLNAQLQTVSTYICTEWATALMNRLFALLEAQEAALEGAKPSPLAGAIGQVSSYLFQALRPLSGLPEDDSQQTQQREARVALQEQVRKYFTTTTPLNGVKGSAKLVEAMVTCDPALLPDVLRDLLCPSTATAASPTGAEAMEVDTTASLLGAFSSDKLAFRLRLAGGACRAATSEVLATCLPLLEPIVTSAAFYNHDEKLVRVATSKLLKDILKGATSIYPTALEPVYAVNADRPVGFPNTPCVGNVKWHVPSAEALPGFVRVLRTVISSSMRDTQQCIQDAVCGDGSGSTRDGTTSPATSEVSAHAGAGAGAGGMVFKKTEELIVSRLTMIEKALRGAAEILGDVASEPEDLTIPPHTPSWQLTSTGRGRLIESLAEPHDRLYLQTLRIEVVRFLVALQDAFYTQIPADHAYAALKNNITVQTLWLELFNLVIVRRMACLKDIENVRKYLRYSVKSSRSSVTNVVYHRLKEHAHRTGKAGAASAATEGSWRQQIATADYWKYHDSSTSAIACLAWAQHIVRCRALSSEAVRRCDVPSFARCLDVLLQRLCNHEYDQIRKIALKQFDAVSTRFGSKMVITVKGVLNSLASEQALTQEGARSYWAVSGTLSVLAQSRVQKRIVSDSQLLQQFLRTLLLDAQRIIQGATEEADKREKLTLKVVEVLLRYVKSWCAAPMLAGTEDNDFMVNLALSSAGGTQGEDAKSALGLRFETFAAFMVLHVIGRPPGIDLQRPDDSNVHAATVTSLPLWQWTLSTLGNPSLHSQPPQNVALAALSRLAFLLSQSATGADAQDPAVQTCVSYVRSMLSPTAPTSTLRAVITSAALSHPRGAEDGMSAQWGSGIEPVLLASQFLKNVVPRRVHGLRSDQNAYSRNFRKEDAALYMSLARGGLLWDSSSGTEDMFAAAHLKALFDSVADLPSSSENETRLNNATRAELFAGVLRAYRMYALAKGIINADNATAAVFLQVLKDGVEKTSLDYARDWFEAVSFAFLDVACRTPQGVLDPIAAYVLERLEQVVLVPTAQSRASITAQGVEGQEGAGDVQQGGDSFTNQSKVLCLACALLRAAQEAAYVTAHYPGINRSSNSGFGQEVLQLVLSYADSGLISPYRSTRNDLAYLLHMLTENTVTGRSESIVEICAKLAAACEGGAAATVTAEDGALAPVSTAQALQFKNAAETVCLVLRCAVHNVPHWRFHGVWARLFAAALIGAGSMTSSAIEAAKMCHDTCLLVCNAIVRARLSTATANDLVGELLTFLLTTAQDKTTPLHSRETLMKCGALLMANNWYTLTADERKVCRDIFAVGLDDVKPEVQRLAQAGMVAYLALFKTSAELASIAAVYVKNSDILVAREKKLRRQSEGSGGASARVAVDIKHQNTVYMMSCVILATPYDLPANYLPTLLTELTRHAVVPALKDIVARTVQLFKRTHQDRWEEFKHAFSADQLDELQGTGAAHYFS